MLDAPVPGKRRETVRQAVRLVFKEMESVGLKEEEVLDRTKWNNDMQYRPK